MRGAWLLSLALVVGCIDTPQRLTNSPDAGVPTSLSLELDWVANMHQAFGAVRVASDGSLRFVGHFQDQLTLDGLAPLNSAGGSDLVIAQLSAEGDFKDAIRDGDVGAEFGVGVVLDSDDYIYRIGLARGLVSVGGQSFTALEDPLFTGFLARYDGQGVADWGVLFDSLDNNIPGALGFDRGPLVVGHLSGTMTLGSTNGVGTDLMAIDGTAGYFARYSDIGEPRQAVAFTGLMNQFPTLVVGGGVGRPFVGGRFAGDIVFDGDSQLTAVGPAEDVFVAGIDSFTGMTNWLLHGQSGPSTTAFVRAGASNRAGDLLMMLEVDGTLTFPRPDVVLETEPGNRDMVLMSISPGGDYLWHVELRSTGIDQPREVVVEPESGFIAVTGEFQGTLEVAGMSAESEGDTDIFVAIFSEGGQLLYLETFGSSELDRGLSLAFDGPSTLYLTATYNGEIDFGGGPVLPTVASASNVLLKFSIEPQF